MNYIELISWIMISSPVLVAASESSSSTSAQPAVFSWITAAVSIGGFLLMAINYVIGWFKDAKADGKITADEVQELTENLSKQVQDLQEQLKDTKDTNKDN